MSRLPLGQGAVAVAVLLALVCADGASAYSYDVPVQAKSPWPEMRRDSRNTASSPIHGRYRGAEPWAFATKRGIFSTPVIGGDDTVYVGSADHVFYALRPDGRPLWKFATGGIIDAAAAIARHSKSLRSAPITIGSGDERLYRLRTNPGPFAQAQDRLELQADPASRRRAAGQLVGGECRHRAGGNDLRRQHRRRGLRDQPGRDTAVGGASGDSRSGPLRRSARDRRPATPSGARLTSTRSRSTRTANSDGRPSRRATSPRRRRSDRMGPCTSPRSITTSTHSTRTPARFAGASRPTRTSTARPRSPRARMGAPPPSTSRPRTVRSTQSTPPVTCCGGTTPVTRSAHLPSWVESRRARGRILYVGSSNGKLYALDAASGRRRWSFDTTPRNPALRDRNDLNGSPALGRRGVYIGGEHGRVWFVPYDYCLHERSSRCDRKPGQDFGKNVNRMFFVTPGGTTVAATKDIRIPPAAVLATRLIVRKGGLTEDAALQAPGSSDQLVSAKPGFAFTTQLSGDGHYLFIRPTGLLRSEYALPGPHRRWLAGRGVARDRFRQPSARPSPSAPAPRGASSRSGCGSAQRPRFRSAGSRFRSRPCCRASTRSASTATT